MTINLRILQDGPYAMPTHSEPFPRDQQQAPSPEWTQPSNWTRPGPADPQSGADLSSLESH
ncbi:MAG: hypothetical protein MK194_12690, partial [Roseibacillus sp.]|nr:hypothetical protein [Roseibacillus sp.]